ncbi:spermidine synthase [Agromyces sp. LHK192]|uniref:spermidine synthase n=1 Tax=Agromyces sp. LHK192 TaxID=2498704 RepID=UPI000FDA10C8|nr:fused MFS/spermidine synthase [Agromyces sp. LHK192]
MGEPNLELDSERVQARFLPERGTNGGFSLVIDGTTQSHVNPDDPLDLQLEYVRSVAAAVDTLHPGSAPISVLHLGGGALTVPRWIAATRPGSRQHVVELLPELFDFVLDVLPLADDVELTVEFDDARAAVDRAARRDGGYDIAMVDVFSGSVAPPAVGTVEFFAALRDLLAPDGVVIVNSLAGRDMIAPRTLAATLLAAGDEVVLLAASAVLDGGPGNVVLVSTPEPVAADGFGAALASTPRPVEVLADDAVVAFAGEVPARHDEVAD